MFEISNYCVTDQWGKEYRCPLEGGLSKKEGYGGSTEDLEVRMHSIVDEDTTVFHIEASLKEKRPYFGSQRYFSCNKGTSFELIMDVPGKMMAVYQYKDWWLRPKFIDSTKDVPQRTQLLIWKKEEAYCMALAVAGKECRADIGPSENGLILTVSSNCSLMNKMEDMFLVLAEGADPYRCIENGVRKVLLLTGRSKMYRGERKFPEVFKYFGWCTWDAFYHKVNEEGIFDKLAELKEKDIPVKWILIDDGWLDADYEKQKLRGLDGAKDKFPQGLSHTVSVAKNKYGIKWAGVWQAVMGYWNGIETGSDADSIMAPYLEQLPDGRKIPRAVQGDTFAFWDEWHNYLRNQCGIDFVKVDGQSAVSLFYQGQKTYGKASSEAQKGLGASAALNFDNNIINCMGMAPEDMWNRPSSGISRSSDDFVPEVPHGFREHAMQNAYNSLLQGQFYWSDWDMFYSSHEENWQNSILRAVSGGPVYVSDAVGRTDREYILPLVLKDGKLLRCQGVGVPTIDCLLEDPLGSMKPLKIFNSYNDDYLVSILNINVNDQKVQGILKVEDIPGLIGKEWWVYLWKSKTLLKLSQGEPVILDIKPNNGEVALILPYNEDKVTPVGLLDKYLCTAAIESVAEYGEWKEIRLFEGGKFGFISENEPEVVLINGKNAQAVSRGNMLWELDCSDVPRAKIEIR